MAALTITAVRTTENTRYINVKHGATTSPGQAVYSDPADENKHKLSDNNAAGLDAVAGIVISPSVDDEWGLIATGGSLIFVGATMAVGETYYLGATPGQIVPDGDLATGNKVTRIGTAESATKINLSIEATGITHA